MPSRFFVTGTDTGIGKTVASALLCAALDAIYWKPIQTGSREGTDRATVMRLAEFAPRANDPRNVLLCAARFAAPGSAARRNSHRLEENQNAEFAARRQI